MKKLIKIDTHINHNHKHKKWLITNLKKKTRIKKWIQTQTTSKRNKNRNDEQATTIESEDEPREKDPEKLCSITLKYCSTVGLIHAGILDKE